MGFFDGFGFKDLIGGIGDIIGTGVEATMNKKMQKRAHEFSHNEAILARDFQAGQFDKSMLFNEKMVDKAMTYNTAQRASQYQTAVGDMKAAGLNPMLAYSQGGAGVTPGPTASVQGGGSHAPSGTTANVPRMDFGSKILQGMASAASIRNMVSMGDKLDAETAKVEAEELLARKRADESTASAGKLRANERQLLADIDKMKAEIAYLRAGETERYASASLKDSQYTLNEIEGRVREGKIGLIQAQKEFTKVMTQLSRYNIPAARNVAREHSKVGGFLNEWAPYINIFNSGANAAKLFK